MSHIIKIKAGVDTSLNKKGFFVCGHTATTFPQAICNFEPLLVGDLFLQTAVLLRSEGRTTESAVYLLWRVDGMICFCEAQSGLCCFLEQKERLPFSLLSILDVS